MPSTLKARYAAAAGGRKRKGSPMESDKQKIVKIAKQVVLSNQETKHLVYENLSTSIGTTPKSYNVMFHGAIRGTSETNFVGESFYLKGISAKFSGTNNQGVGNAAPYKQAIRIYTMIVAAKDFRTITNLAAGDFCDTSFSANVAERHYVDPNKARILAKDSFLCKPGFLDGVNGQLEVWHTELYAPIEKRVRFRNFGTNTELSEWNYYVVAWGDSNILGSEVPMSVSFKAYIKDA